MCRHGPSSSEELQPSWVAVTVAWQATSSMDTPILFLSHVLVAGAVCVQLFSPAVETAPELCPSLFTQGLQKQGVQNLSLGTRSLCVQHLSMCLKRKPSQALRGELENEQQLCALYQSPHRV